MNNIHNIAWVVNLTLAICLSSNVLGKPATATDSTNTQKPPIIQHDSLAIITEPKGARILKDFDKIRKYESYDPVTKTWSAVEDFERVDILTDSTQKHTEDYLYYSFWAYDPVARQWKRVDIRNYGYQLQEGEDTTKKKPFNFWKNFGMKVSAGGGGNYYSNSLNNLNLMVRKGTNEFFLQSTNSTEQIQGKGYRIRWFKNNYSKVLGIQHEAVVHDENSFEELTGRNTIFKGYGFSIPIFLDFHYTFFKKLRVGVGGNFNINYLKSMTVRQITYTIDKPWFYHVKLFSILAYKVFQKGVHTVLVDTHLGIAYDLGNELIKNIKNPINNTFYGSLGVAHERRLNAFLSFFYRLSGELKQFKSTKEFLPQKASVKLWQPVLNVEAGLTINFSRTKPLKEEASPIKADQKDKQTILSNANPIENSTTTEIDQVP